MKEIEELENELARIANLVKNDHHKSRDAEIILEYDAWNRTWSIRYDGYVFGEFSIYYSNLKSILKDAVKNLRKYGRKNMRKFRKAKVN